MNLDEFSQPEGTDSVEAQVVEKILETAQACQGEETFDFETEEELIESRFNDEEFVPVYDDYQHTDHGDREFFTYEYICRVLDYKDSHPLRSFKTLQNRFKRVKNTSYISRFTEYRTHLGTHRERILAVSQFCKDTFDRSRAEGSLLENK